MSLQKPRTIAALDRLIIANSKAAVKLRPGCRARRQLLRAQNLLEDEVEARLKVDALAHSPKKSPRTRTVHAHS